MLPRCDSLKRLSGTERTPDERPGLDMAESHPAGGFFQACELIGREEPGHRFASRVRPEVLPECQHIAPAGAEVGEHGYEFRKGFAQPEHESRFRQDAGSMVMDLTDDVQ